MERIGKEMNGNERKGKGSEDKKRIAKERKARMILVSVVTYLWRSNGLSENNRIVCACCGCSNVRTCVHFYVDTLMDMDSDGGPKGFPLI